MGEKPVQNKLKPIKVRVVLEDLPCNIRQSSKSSMVYIFLKVSMGDYLEVC